MLLLVMSRYKLPRAAGLEWEVCQNEYTGYLSEGVLVMFSHGYWWVLVGIGGIGTRWRHSGLHKPPTTMPRTREIAHAAILQGEERRVLGGARCMVL